eukprot:TRINITY_DN7457_c0_g1_i1.p1 TRINITY_DN7457_c0_g1~~TRINITY_DN7457_c0_g1_i1.p1  ORF type:complete len:527 (-),score=153.86 TRINITY_DN7457_c0_g1_i1:234-1814(-)
MEDENSAKGLNNSGKMNELFVSPFAEDESPVSTITTTTTSSPVNDSTPVKKTTSAKSDSKMSLSPSSDVLAGERDGLILYSKNFQILVKGGTLEKIIERLTNETAPDNDFVDTFLLTYRTYITPTELLEKIIDRYRFNPEGSNEADDSTPIPEDDDSGKAAPKLSSKIIRLRIANVLKRWLSNHYHDFADDSQMTDTLNDALEKTYLQKDSTEYALGTSIKKLIDEQQQKLAEGKKKEKEFIFTERASRVPKPVEPKHPDNFEEFDVGEIARQLCLFQQHLFRQIHPKECLNQAWNKKKEDAPNILSLIQTFNDLSSWVSTQVVSHADIKDRVSKIKRFIKISIKCKEYNNFDACQAILAGLNASPVFRLKKSWMKVKTDKKLYKDYLELKELLSQNGNFKQYRARLKTLNPPCLPYLGVYLTDLVFIDENRDYLTLPSGRTDMINFDKMRKVAAVIRDIMMHQQTPYAFFQVDPIFNYFSSGLKYLTPNEAFAKSREVETKEEVQAAEEKEKKELARSNSKPPAK